MSREVIFVQTATSDERTFLIKIKEKLKEMDEDSEDIESKNLITYYQQRPKSLERYCLAGYTVELNIVVPKNVTFDENDCDEEYDNAG